MLLYLSARESGPKNSVKADKDAQSKDVGVSDNDQETRAAKESAEGWKIFDRTLKIKQRNF